jgi:predicted phage replisome organizer
MAETKRYYWLKLKEDFFGDKPIKKLRKIAGGDTYTIIYLKLMLLSLKENGRLFYEGVEDSFYEELALEINEEADNVRFTLLYLQKTGLLEEISDKESFLTRIPECVGSETEKAELMRKKRAREKAKALENGNNVTNALPPVTKCYTDIDIEKDKEINNIIGDKPKRTRFTPPTIEEVQAYCVERQNKVDAERFIDYYTSNGWMVGKNKMKDWKSAVRTWERNGYNISPKTTADKNNNFYFNRDEDSLDDVF